MTVLSRAASRAVCSAVAAVRQPLWRTPLSMSRTAALSRSSSTRPFSVAAPRAQGPERESFDNDGQPADPPHEKSQARMVLEAGAKSRAAQDKCTMYLAGVPADVGNEEIWNYMSSFGKVVNTFSSQNRKNQFSYVMVEFADRETMLKACDQLDNSFWHARRLSAKPRAVRSGFIRPPSRHLHIGRLAKDASDAQLSELFAGLEGLTAVRISIQYTRDEKLGFAHADFKSVEAATEAITVLNGKELNGFKIRANFSTPPLPAKVRYEKKQQYQVNQREQAHDEGLATEPAATEPAAAEPADAEPADTEPADTEPAAREVAEEEQHDHDRPRS